MTVKELNKQLKAVSDWQEIMIAIMSHVLANIELKKAEWQREAREEVFLKQKRMHEILYKIKRLELIGHQAVWSKDIQDLQAEYKILEGKLEKLYHE